MTRIITHISEICCIDFKKGDPYTKVEQGFARLPGDGYTALHPELEGIDPEDYPDIDKMRILADVAPTHASTRSTHRSCASRAMTTLISRLNTSA